LKHSSLRALIAIVFAACVAIVGRTASAAPLDFTLTPTIVALASPAASPAAKATATPAPTPTPTAAPPAKFIQLSGQADVGYAATGHNTVLSGRVFDGPASVNTHGGPVSPSFGGTNGFTQNAPNIQDIYLASTWTAGPVGGELDAAFGSDPNTFQSFPANNSSFYSIVQAYVTYTYKSLTLTAGKFNTLAGAEYIKSSLDWEYSKSLLNGFAIPFTHTGVRLTFAPSSKINYIVGENLGWDTINIQATHGTTTEEGLIINPSTAINWTVQAYQGKAGDGFGGFTPRRLVDTVLVGHVTPALTLQGNYDYGTQVASAGNVYANGAGVARWQGGAAYANYQFTPKWSGTVRYEGFRDAGGYRTNNDQMLEEKTVTAQYQPSSPIMLRVEYRWDHSNKPVFTQTDASGLPSQRNLGVEAITKF
jgi:hypothetical protein